MWSEKGRESRKRDIDSEGKGKERQKVGAKVERKQRC